jgi:hypothetical protein
LRRAESLFDSMCRLSLGRLSISRAPPPRCQRRAAAACSAQPRLLAASSLAGSARAAPVRLCSACVATTHDRQPQPLVRALWRSVSRAALLLSPAHCSWVAVRCADAGLLAPVVQMMSLSFCAGAPACYGAPPMLRAARATCPPAVQLRAARLPLQAAAAASMCAAAHVTASRRVVRAAALPLVLAAAAGGHARKTWLAKYEQLKLFVAANQHANVPARDPANPQLARWVLTQREKYAADKRLRDAGRASCKLSAEEVELLERLGFTWSPMESLWMERYEDLKAFAAANGHASVPRYLDGNQQLAAWAMRQRGFHNAGSLSPEHRALLDAVGFVYTPRDESFEAGFAKLQAYAAAHYGSTEVSGTYAEDLSFGVWVRDKRKACVKNKLVPHFVEQLASLSYAWSDSDDAFAHGLQQLTAFAAAHDGSTAVPHGEDVTTKETAQLHEWCRMQRLRRVQSTLSEQRIGQLDALGFTWKSRS